MPWSDWQTGDTGVIGWTDLGRGLRNAGWDYPGDWRRYSRFDDRSIANIYGSALSDPDGFPEHPVYEQLNGAFFTLADSWKQDRAYKPKLLRTMTFGVDYDRIPGAPDGDDEELAQYETHENNTPLAFTGPDLFLVSATKGGGESSLNDGDGRWSLGVVLGAVAPPAGVFPDNAWYSDGEWPGLGTVFAEGDHTTLTTTNFKSSFPDAIGATDMFVSVKMTGAPPVYGNAEQATFSIGMPVLTYQMPRWRYWIPGSPPLRLRQRDDNLFLNAPHLRNRASRQTTNRLRSYD